MAMSASMCDVIQRYPHAVTFISAQCAALALVGAFGRRVREDEATTVHV